MSGLCLGLESNIPTTSLPCIPPFCLPKIFKPYKTSSSICLKHGHLSNPTGTIEKALLGISVCRTSEKLLSSKQSSGSLSCIHGMRFLSLSWVILGHLSFPTYFKSIFKPRTYPRCASRLTFLLLPIHKTLIFPSSRPSLQKSSLILGVIRLLFAERVT